VGVLIDSGVLIDAERELIDFAGKLKGREDEEFYLSVVSASELLHGVYRAPKAAVRARRSAFVEAVLERFPILEIDIAAARMHARIWAELASAGKKVGPHDLWIAASALAHGLTVVTTNIREFRMIPGLAVESWH
jgi:tRNA(fMet)-specific endonuclease VapC